MSEWVIVLEEKCGPHIRGISDRRLRNMKIAQREEMAEQLSEPVSKFRKDAFANPNILDAPITTAREITRTRQTCLEKSRHGEPDESPAELKTCCEAFDRKPGWSNKICGFPKNVVFPWI